MKFKIIVGLLVTVALNADLVEDSLNFVDGCGNAKDKKRALRKAKTEKSASTQISESLKKVSKKKEPIDEIEESLNFRDGCGNK